VVRLFKRRVEYTSMWAALVESNMTWTATSIALAASKFSKVKS
jgi:hypothetical protein